MKFYIAMICLVSMLIIAPISYMIADTEAPYIYDESMSYVIPERTQAGHQLIVHWSVKVNRVCPGEIIRNIVDAKSGAKISYDPTRAAGTVELSDKELNRTFQLPSGIAPGEKFYYADGEYQCNFLQRFYPLHSRTPRLPFTILPNQ